MECPKVTEWMSLLLKKLFTMQAEGILCDAVIECKDGEKLPVHSCVLAAASPVFQQALAAHGSDLIGHQKVLTGIDFSKHVWMLLIKFLYSGELEIGLSEQAIDSLKDLARKLLIVLLEKKIDKLKLPSLIKIGDIKAERSDLTTTEQSFDQDMNCDAEVLKDTDSSVKCDTDNMHTIENLQKTKTKNSTATCRYCNLTFTSSALLAHYKETHWKYKCSHCEKCFEKRNSLTKHENMVHSNVEQEFACKKCEMVTKSSAHYLVHLKTHKEYKCTHCSFEGKSKSKLMSHLEEEHKSQKLYKCSFQHCLYSANSEFTIKTHESTVHTTERSFKCTLCSKLFKSQLDLKRHLPIHSHEYMCNECDASFARRFSLDDHKRKKHGAEPLLCPQCDEVFTSMTLRSKHIREVHQGRVTKLKKIPCKLCPKIVKNMGELRRHMRVHTGEKLHPCDLCSRSFATKHDLQNHKMIHSGEKPFLCSYCSFRCNREYNLRVHERKHAWEQDKVKVTCTVCQPEVPFKCLNDLEKHKRKEHKDNLDTAKNIQTMKVEGSKLPENQNYEVQQEDAPKGEEVLLHVSIDQVSENTDTDISTQMFLSDGKVLTYKYGNANQTVENVILESAPIQNQLLENIKGCSEDQVSNVENMLTYVQDNDTQGETWEQKQVVLNGEEILTYVQGANTQEENKVVLNSMESSIQTYVQDNAVGETQEQVVLTGEESNILTCTREKNSKEVEQIIVADEQTLVTLDETQNNHLLQAIANGNFTDPCESTVTLYM